MKLSSGFTLIELLVVVLIIGILSAVALPQYKKAVEKSRASTVWPLLKAVGEAQQRYFLANGSYATSFDELDVEIPWTGNAPWLTSSSYFQDVRSNEDWSLQLASWGGNAAVYLGRLSGPYAGVGFVYWLQKVQHPSSIEKISCAERNSMGVVYNGERGSYCGKIIPVSKLNYQDSSLITWEM